MDEVLRKEEFFRDDRFPFHITRYRIGRGEVIPSHTHDFVELVFVVEGDASHVMAGHTYRLRPGDVFVLEPSAYHSYIGSEHAETEVINVLFEPRFLKDELEVLMRLPSFVNFFYFLPFMRRNASFAPYQPLEGEAMERIRDHLTTIEEEYNGQREGYQLIVKTRWIECLVWLSRYLRVEEPSSPGAAEDEDWIRTARLFVEEHYAQPLSLAQISKLCGMSVSTFTAKFKEATGQSFLEYKQSVQIRHACALLADTGRKVLDIALETGFNDISFFNKVFRKHTGVSPSEYRRRHA